MRLIQPALVILLLYVTAGCSSTHVTSTWKAPGIVPQVYDKIIVLGIVNDADRTMRERMENHLVGDLKSHGYNAVSAFKEYGPKAFENMTEEQANNKFANDGIKAVITVVLLDKKSERRYVPANMASQNQFFDYYQRVYSRILSPGYFQVTTKYFWESNFYDLTDSKLLYSVQTQSFDPTTTDNLAHEYGLTIVHSMMKNNVLQKQSANAASSY